MPLCPESYDDIVNDVAARLPVGSTIKFYSAVTDLVEGPDPADELPVEGGYDTIVTTSAFSTSTGGENRASVTVASGTVTAPWPETGIAWKGWDPDGVPRYWDFLQAPVEVGDDEIGGPISVELDIYVRSAGG